ncbi:hypothetical protein [Phormidium sp. CCY1219]|nr:hypothetical protein [Phormidium sp. CCY1219]MEB3827512.1 hypothetical protein [Phormidium sp. CCY1219]
MRPDRWILLFPLKRGDASHCGSTLCWQCLADGASTVRGDIPVAIAV